MKILIFAFLIAAYAQDDKLSKANKDILWNFLLTVHQTFKVMSGGPVFSTLENSFNATGISQRHHCAAVSATLDSRPQTQTIKFIKRMLLKLQKVRSQSHAQIVENYRRQSDHPWIRFIGNNPRLTEAWATVVKTPPLVDCVLLAMVDNYRHWVYVAFFAIAFLGMFFTVKKVVKQAMLIVQLGTPILIPPAFFAINLFIFYLFYKKEIDPIAKIFKNYLG